MSSTELPAAANAPHLSEPHSPITIRKMLDLAAAHLPARMRPDLPGTEDDLPSQDNVTAARLRYGYLLWVPTDPKHHSEEGDPVSPEVLRIQQYARAQGCDYVLLDPDGPPIEDLPIYPD